VVTKSDEKWRPSAPRAGRKQSVRPRERSPLADRECERERRKELARYTSPRRPGGRTARRALAISNQKEPACKPGSVESSHSSGIRVTAYLERPTRELVWAHSTLPYSVLLRVGFAVPQGVTTCAVRSYRTFSPLPAVAGRRFVFCGTFRRLAPPRRYLAPCPMEPGLSSRIAPSDCPADSRG
jgi:hypothetical protein